MAPARMERVQWSVVRSGYLLGLLCLAGCGRLGFGSADGGVADLSADGLEAGDGTGDLDATRADATAGPGYVVTTGSMTYGSLPGAATVPGFVVGADDENYAMTLPFPFTFYGTSYTSISISVNGFVTFGAPPTGVAAYLNACPLDATSPAVTIAVFWDDLFSNTAIAPSGSVDYAQDVSGADRWFAVEWRDLDAYFRAGAGNNHFQQNLRVTQRLVLHESGVIEMKYGPRTAPTLDRDCGLDRHRGCSATIGLRAATTPPSKTVQCGNDVNALSPGFTPIAPDRWFMFTPS